MIDRNYNKYIIKVFLGNKGLSGAKYPPQTKIKEGFLKKLLILT